MLKGRLVLIPEFFFFNKSSEKRIEGSIIVILSFFDFDNNDEKGISRSTLLKDRIFSFLILRFFISLIPIDGGKNERETEEKVTLFGNCWLIFFTIKIFKKINSIVSTKSIKKNRQKIFFFSSQLF